MTLFGRDTGRLSALARGARKSQRRFAGGLGLCAVGTASLRERAGRRAGDARELRRRRRATRAFGTDVARMAHAAYAAELVGKLCAPRQVEAASTTGWRAFLGLLDATGASAERLRVFELGLLGRLGFGPVVDGLRRVRRRNVAAGRPSSYRWDPDRGGAVCTGCARGGPAACAPAVRAALVRLAAHAARRRDAPSRCRPTSTATAARRCSRSSSTTSAVRCTRSNSLPNWEAIHERIRPRARRCSASATSRSTSRDLAAAERFWVDVMGYEVEWRPDPTTSTCAAAATTWRCTAARRRRRRRERPSTTSASPCRRPRTSTPGRRTSRRSGVALKTQPKTHRDGSRSIYFHGPEGLLIQIIHHTPISSGP